MRVGWKRAEHPLIIITEESKQHFADLLKVSVTAMSSLPWFWSLMIEMARTVDICLVLFSCEELSLVLSSRYILSVFIHLSSSLKAAMILGRLT